MNVKFIKKASHLNFYKEGTKLVYFKCFPNGSITYNTKLNDIEIGTSIGVYLFTFYAKLVYNSISLELNHISSCIISDNTISTLGNDIFLLHSSPHIFNKLARLKLSGVNEVNPSILLGDCLYNAKIRYDNPVASIKDIGYKRDYQLSIMLYWDKNNKLHFAPYHSFYPLNSLMTIDNYSKVVRDMLGVKRPKVWGEDAYLIYEAIVSNFDIAWLRRSEL